MIGARRNLLAVCVVLLAAVTACAPEPWPSTPAGARGTPAQAAAPAPHPDRVTVAPGDTLYGLARRYRVPVRSVIETNHLTPPYRLAAGTVLVLPRLRTHTVRPGETLNGVARLYGVDVSTLAATNHLAPPYVIRSGAALALPAPVETARLAPPAPVAAAPAAAPPRRKPAAPPAPPAEVARASPPPAPVKPPPRQTASMPPVVPPPVPRAAPPPPPAAELAVSGPGFIWPVHGRILAGFGGGNGTQNDGINLAAPAGTPVLAAAAGVVAYAGNELRGYGNLILIKHDKGFMTAYAHNAVLLVQRGDRVRRGEPIAKVGATGAVSEPQLHFEIRRGTRALDPAAYLPTLSAAAGG